MKKLYISLVLSVITVFGLNSQNNVKNHLRLSQTAVLTGMIKSTQIIPIAPTVAVVDNCNGTSTLTASNYTGTLLWSTMETTPSITVTVAGAYTVTQTVDGITGEQGSGTAAPKTAPPAPTVTVVNNCDSTSTLTASNYTGTLLWCTHETTPSITVTEAGPHWVSQIVNGCTSKVDTVFANPKTPIHARVTIAADTNPVCSGSSVTLTAMPVNGGTSPVYQWYNGSTPVGNNSPMFTYTPVNGDLIKVMMTSDATPCLTGSPTTSNTLDMVVSPNVEASVKLEVSKNPARSEETVTFVATPQGGGASPVFRWFRNNMLIPITGLEYTCTPLDKDEVYVEMTSNASPCLTGSPVNSNTITMSVSIGASLDQNGADKIRIYSVDKTIFVNCRDEVKQILLYNSLGTLIGSEQHVNGLTKFDMNFGTSQYYFVKIITQNTVYTQRVLLK